MSHTCQVPQHFTMSPAPREKDVQPSAVPVACREKHTTQVPESQLPRHGKVWPQLFQFWSFICNMEMHGNAKPIMHNVTNSRKHTKTIITKLHVDMPSQSISCAKCWTLLDITPVQLGPLMINSTQDDLARAAQVSSHLCRSKGGHPWHQKQKCSKRLPTEEISTQEWAYWNYMELLESCGTLPKKPRDIRDPFLPSLLWPIPSGAPDPPVGPIHGWAPRPTWALRQRGASLVWPGAHRCPRRQTHWHLATRMPCPAGRSRPAGRWIGLGPSAERKWWKWWKWWTWWSWWWWWWWWNHQHPQGPYVAKIFPALRVKIPQHPSPSILQRLPWASHGVGWVGTLWQGK